AAPNSVIYQSIPGGAKVARGTAVNLVVSVALTPPVLKLPANGGIVPRTSVQPVTTPVPSTPALPSPAPDSSAATSAKPSAAPSAPPNLLQWSQTETYVGRWQVTVQQEACAVQFIPFATKVCGYVSPTILVVTTPSATPYLAFAQMLPPLAPSVFN